jgi:hypothetical protein
VNIVEENSGRIPGVAPQSPRRRRRIPANPRHHMFEYKT